jgi:anti-anti-sigma factor
MKLSVVSIDKQLVRIDVEGEITTRDFRADGRDPFETLLGAGWASHKVILNFSHVTSADSSAIGWLMTCRREFERRGGAVVLHSIHPRVRQVLDMLRVGKAVPLVRDEAAALAALAAPPAPAPAPAKSIPEPFDTVPMPHPAPAPARTPAPTRAASPAAAPAPAPEEIPFAPATPSTARPRKRKSA